MNYSAQFKKTGCPHCGEPILIEHSDMGWAIYTPVDDTTPYVHVAPPAEEEEPAEEQPSTDVTPKKRKCKACGESGHRSDTCPLNRTKSFDGLEDVEVRNTVVGLPPGAVSKEDFEKAKDLQADGGNSLTIARELEIPITASGRIMGSDNYEEYLAKF
jgi:ribosomal protein S27AE